MTLSFEHIHKDLTDIECEIDYSTYRGSTKGFSSDDPSEIDIHSITFLEDVKTEDGSVEFRKGSYAFLDHKVKEQILENI